MGVVGSGRHSGGLVGTGGRVRMRFGSRRLLLRETFGLRLRVRMGRREEGGIERRVLGEGRRRKVKTSELVRRVDFQLRDTVIPDDHGLLDRLYFPFFVHVFPFDLVIPIDVDHSLLFLSLFLSVV